MAAGDPVAQAVNGNEATSGQEVQYSTVVALGGDMGDRGLGVLRGVEGVWRVC